MEPFQSLGNYLPSPLREILDGIRHSMVPDKQVQIYIVAPALFFLAVFPDVEPRFFRVAVAGDFGI